MRVVLHTPALGALELRLGLHGGALSVNVVADAAVAAAASGGPARAARARCCPRRASSPRVEVVERRGAPPPAPVVVPVGRGASALPEPRKKVAAALSYPGHGAPKVVAAGKGHVAERILELAREAGVPTREDSALAQALAELELGHRDPAAALPGRRGGARVGAAARPQPPSLTGASTGCRGGRIPVRFRPRNARRAVAAAPASGGIPSAHRVRQPVHADAAAPLRDDRRPDERREPPRPQRQSRTTGTSSSATPRATSATRSGSTSAAAAGATCRTSGGASSAWTASTSRSATSCTRTRTCSRSAARPTATSCSRRTASTSATCRDHEYDFVMSTIVLQHIAVYDIRFQYLQEFFRVMKPGGLLSFQMGYGEGYGKAGYYDNHYHAESTNSAHDTLVTTRSRSAATSSRSASSTSRTRSGRRSTTATRTGSSPRRTSRTSRARSASCATPRSRRRAPAGRR